LAHLFLEALSSIVVRLATVVRLQRRFKALAEFLFSGDHRSIWDREASLLVISDSQPPAFPGGIDALRALGGQQLTGGGGLLLIARKNNDDGVSFPQRILVEEQLVDWKALSKRFINGFAEYCASDRSADPQYRGGGGADCNNRSHSRDQQCSADGA